MADLNQQRLADQNGKISTRELRDVLQAVGVDMSKDEVKKVMSTFDTNKDGSLDFAEFLVMLRQFAQDDRDAEKAMRMFDEDGDGLVTVTELRRVLRVMGKKLSQEQAEKIVKKYDMDKDGKLNYDEFVAMIKTHMF